jgi:HEAT repeat protein
MQVPHFQFVMKKRCLLALLAWCALCPATFAGVEQTVIELIPKLAAEKVEDRYGPQMELQGLAANASRPGAETERVALAGVLAAKATDTSVPQPARVWIVRQLEYIGAAESVPALTTLLAGQNAELQDCARRALEKNPAPAAGDSLRAALEKGGEPAWRTGLIHSLGERGDVKAVALIQASLSTEGPAAVAALGKIASDEAVSALWEAYGKGVAGAGDALATAADRLLATGKRAKAEEVFRGLYLAGTAGQGATPQEMSRPAAPFPVRRAALIGLATLNSKPVRQYIQHDLQSKDPRLELAAVDATAVTCGKEGPGEALAPLLPGLSPTAKVYVLRTLQPGSEEQVLAATGDADEQVQVAALERLGQIGSALSVPALVKLAAQDASAKQKAATAALASMPGRDAGAAIAKLAAQGDARTRATAIQALGQRGDQSAAAVLLNYAGEAEPAVSAAACAALAKLGTDRELDGLIRLVLAGKTPDSEKALHAVASRVTDKPAAARKLIAQTQTAGPEQLAPLLEALAMLGGNDALTAVSGLAGSSKQEVKDAAVRALANWQEFSGTKALLVVAFDPHCTRVHSVLAIQAVARLVKSAEKEPAAARLQAVQAAMKVARRDEEKKLLLSAYASVPDARAAEAIKPLLSDPTLKSEAGLAGVTLAQALLKVDRPAAKSLAQAVKDAQVSEEVTGKAEGILKKR